MIIFFLFFSFLFFSFLSFPRSKFSYLLFTETNISPVRACVRTHSNIHSTYIMISYEVNLTTHSELLKYLLFVFFLGNVDASSVQPKRSTLSYPQHTVCVPSWLRVLCVVDVRRTSLLPSSPIPSIPPSSILSLLAVSSSNPIAQHLLPSSPPPPPLSSLHPSSPIPPTSTVPSTRHHAHILV
jgi:hypothetical protein